MKKWNFSSKLMLISATSAAIQLTSCLPVPNYPIEPTIEFLAFEVDESNHAVLSFQFTDGDGNLGLDQTDTLPPFCTSCENHFNLKCEYDELREGEWIHIPLIPAQGQVPFYYRVPRVEPSGTHPALNGVIEIAMNTWSLKSDYDTLRFRLTLEDRDLNISNKDTTRVILK
ncbi:MAG TPA: hypothetical protein EYN67_19910 [Flavobacteriales bacterium]|jgi:hypothetical protein|nr:hypothetical protein [Flavobacteriales bacterium]HIB76163.1 hypothetical protein [Flavobacteriales bacterium]HIO16271.1 hypothetical protein [Flavobacteriales bacterium]